jgi:hypothetical protein
MAEKATPPHFKLFNSMTRRKEPFLPAVDGKVSMFYVQFIQVFIKKLEKMASSTGIHSTICVVSLNQI